MRTYAKKNSASDGFSAATIYAKLTDQAVFQLLTGRRKTDANIINSVVVYINIIEIRLIVNHGYCLYILKI